MKLLDRFMGLDPRLAQPGDFYYELYSVGLRWTAVGTIAIGAGVGSASCGIEHGVDLVYGGGPVAFLGALTFSAMYDHLKEDSYEE